MDKIDKILKDFVNDNHVDDLPPGYHSIYFRPMEFQCCNPSCSIKQMDDRLLEMLDYAREKANVPFVLTSAYRSKDWELLHGRAGTSSHCKGLAVDITAIDSYKRSRVIIGLVRAGFRRIGIYKTFIHADCDDSKPDAIWIDGSWTNTKKDG